MKTLLIQAYQEQIAEQEVRNALTPEVLQQSKGKTLVPYTIVEEGDFTVQVLENDQKVNQTLTWPRAVIQKVQATLQKGTKLFHHHNQNNSTDGRPSVGTVVGSMMKEIGGKLRTIAIAAMEKADALKYDVCSIEADIQEIGNVVAEVSNITGIAVANHKEEQPAFTNAKRMNIIQCFVRDRGGQNLDHREETYMPVTLEDLMGTPLGIIKDAVKARQVHPNQLFELSDFESDRELSGIFSERNQFKTKIDDLTKELGTTKEELVKVQKSAAVSTAKPRLESMIPKGTTDLQKQFILSRFKPETMGSLEDSELTKFIEESKEDFTAQAKLFGVNVEGDKLPDDDGDGTATSTDKSIDEVFDE